MQYQGIDAHQHFWRLDRSDYSWLTPALKPIYRDFLPPDLTPFMRDCGIARTILVQAAPSEAETDFMLELAAATDFVAGVVGWVDLEASDAPVRLEYLASRPKLCGIRPMLQDIADPAWILQPRLRPALREMAGLGLRFDALVKPHQLGATLRLLETHPDLNVVIDHGAKPAIAADEFADWAAAMQTIARSTAARCKLSGLVTEAGEGWSVSSLDRYVDHLLQCFGPERLMWGSDWPVVDLAGGYLAWWRAARKCLSGIDAEAEQWIFGRAAAAFYGV